MVQSIIDINNTEDRILNIVKAKYGLKNKSQAISLILNTYSESFLEPQLRPEFIKELGEIKKEKGVEFSSIDELRNHLEK